MMRKILLTGAIVAGLAGIGHNGPPGTTPTPITKSQHQAVLPRRVVDENRRNQKLKQKLRRAKQREIMWNYTRAQRKTRKFGHGYRPGKLFKGHRV